MLPQWIWGNFCSSFINYWKQDGMLGPNSAPFPHFPLPSTHIYMPEIMCKGTLVLKKEIRGCFGLRDLTYDDGDINSECDMVPMLYWSFWTGLKYLGRWRWRRYFHDRISKLWPGTVLSWGPGDNTAEVKLKATFYQFCTYSRTLVARELKTLRESKDSVFLI